MKKRIYNGMFMLVWNDLNLSVHCLKIYDVLHAQPLLFNGNYIQPSHVQWFPLFNDNHVQRPFCSILTHVQLSPMIQLIRTFQKFI
jgi:hypothetical protein